MSGRSNRASVFFDQIEDFILKNLSSIEDQNKEIIYGFEEIYDDIKEGETQASITSNDIITVAKKLETSMKEELDRKKRKLEKLEESVDQLIENIILFSEDFKDETFEPQHKKPKEEDAEESNEEEYDEKLHKIDETEPTLTLEEINIIVESQKGIPFLEMKFD